MTNRRTLTVSIFATAILALALPMLAVAQGGYGYPDYGRNRDDDYRRDRNTNNGRYDQRHLRDSIHRLDRLAKDFEKALDRELDRSHEDGTRHEDRLNREARDFRNAVSNLKSQFGNGRDMNRSVDDAQRVMREANRTEQVARHHFGNRRLASDWAQIRRELQAISSAYGFGYGGYNNGGNFPTGRNDRNDRNDRNRNRNNNDWWRNIPWPN